MNGIRLRPAGGLPLAFVILLLTGCFSSESVAPEGDECVATRAVGMTNSLRFDPPCIRVEAGQTVRWTNSSGVAHTVTADPERAANPANVSLPAGAQAFHSGNMPPDAIFTHTFTVPGRYEYVCIPHEGAAMVGTVIVAP